MQFFGYHYDHCSWGVLSKMWQTVRWSEMKICDLSSYCLNRIFPIFLCGNIWWIQRTSFLGSMMEIKEVLSNLILSHFCQICPGNGICKGTLVSLCAYFSWLFSKKKYIDDTYWRWYNVTVTKWQNTYKIIGQKLHIDCNWVKKLRKFWQDFMSKYENGWTLEDFGHTKWQNVKVDFH